MARSIVVQLYCRGWNESKTGKGMVQRDGQMIKNEIGITGYNCSVQPILFHPLM